MKKLLLLSFFALAFVLTSCKKDDNTTNVVATDPIVGTWLSDGSNVAYGLRLAFKVKKITATFNADKTYTVIQIDSSNVSTTYTGTIVTSTSTYKDTLSTSFTKGATINKITANQATPSVLTAEGIFAISGSNMNYEVLNTALLSSGWTISTPEGGFGSIAYNGTKTSIYVQKFVKQ